MTKQKSLKIKINPTPGYLLLEPMEAEAKTETGIYLPESAGEKPLKAKVLEVGADLITKEGTVNAPAKKGQMVIYKKWGGNEVKVGAKEYLFAKFEDILAIVE